MKPPAPETAPPGKADFSHARAAAQQAAGTQHYPKACLYVVATPIGNLADITLRALHVLELVDAVACEDTRHTAALLRAYGIASKPLIALHQHNEASAAQRIIALLRAGQRVAYASDAGTPAISDPGARLAAACTAAGLPVIPLPGASSVTAALSVAGTAGDGQFVFLGFLPHATGERGRAIGRLAQEDRTCVLLEAPHRMHALSRELATGLGDRPVTVARELTKQFEEIATLPCSELPGWLQQDAGRARGEFVLVVHPAQQGRQAAGPSPVLRLLLGELPLKSAVRLAAQITGAPRNELYRQALALQARQ